MFKISFEFDETSKQVSNVKVTEIETKAAPTFGYEVEVLDNKLKLSKSAIEKLNAKADDRISVQYITEGVGKSAPVIGKAGVFTDNLDGNRLAAKGTVSFRGEKRNTLIQFGTFFNLEPYSEGIWKLIPVAIDENLDLAQEENELVETNNNEIDNEIKSLIDDDLPF